MICITLKSLAVDDSVQKPHKLWNQKLSTTRMPPQNNAYNSYGRNLMNSGVFIGQIATFLQKITGRCIQEFVPQKSGTLHIYTYQLHTISLLD